MDWFFAFLLSMAWGFFLFYSDEENAEAECENALNRAVDLDPNNPEAFHAVASLRKIQGRHEEAGNAIEKCISLLAAPGESLFST